MPRIIDTIILPFLNDKMKTPALATPGSAGVDLQANIAEPVVLLPGEARIFPSAVQVHIADPGLAGILLPRSGLGSKHGIVLGNLVGLIDSDYQGEIGVCLWNRSDKEYTIEPGERIAQLVLMPVVQPEFNIVQDFTRSDRGDRGFGHSGRV